MFFRLRINWTEGKNRNSLIANVERFAFRDGSGSRTVRGSYMGTKIAINNIKYY